MAAKAKKALKLSLKKSALFSKPSTPKPTADDEFLPLEGGAAMKLPELKEVGTRSTVLYIGRIPHGFYEKEMEAYFSQFGKIKRLRVARNRKTGRSRHFGFVEFQDAEVAEIVADCMHNYLLFESILQVHLIPPERVHPKLWKGFNYQYKAVDWVEIERKRQNKVRTLDEHKRLVEKIMKCDKKRQKIIDAAGLDYECPDIVGEIQSAPKRIKFAEAD